MAWARTVAVVVPSPATSEVFEATSRPICAPMFSSALLNSISLATVAPSLVIVGDPNFFSMTTLRPLGPSVTFTASARVFTPRRIAWRESSPCRICFAISNSPYIWVPQVREANLGLCHRRTRLGGNLLLQNAEDFFLTHDEELFAIDLDLSAGILAEED